MARKKYSITATAYDKQGRKLSVGQNDYSRTHPIQAELAARVGLHEKQMLHAEVMCIIRARSNQIYKIKIERYDSKGNPKLAKPCPICELAIKEAGIKFVEYTIG